MRCIFFILVGLVGAGADESGKEHFDEILGEVRTLAEVDFLSDRQQQRMVDLMNTLRTQYAKEPESLLRLGIYVEEQGRASDALVYWNKALEAKSKFGNSSAIHARVHQVLGQVELARGNALEAEKHARQSIGLAPNDLGGHELLIASSMKTGAVFEVLPIIEAAAQRLPNSVEAQILYLNLLEWMGSWAKLRQALDGQPESLRRNLHYYEAQLAAIEGEPLRQFAHHAVGRFNGDVHLSTTQQSGAWLDAVSRRREEEIPAAYRSHSKAYTVYDRSLTAADALAVLTDIHPSFEMEKLVVEFMSATALNRLNRVKEAEARWRTVIATHPDFIPGYCGLAEVVEAQGRQEQADALFDKAQDMSRRNQCTVLIDRLGGRYALARDGVLVAGVRPRSPLSKTSLKEGDVLLELDGEPLVDMPPLSRMRKARLFQGGRLTFRTKQGLRRTEEMELVLFR